MYLLPQIIHLRNTLPFLFTYTADERIFGDLFLLDAANQRFSCDRAYGV
jgi:hypothetical protein